MTVLVMRDSQGAHRRADVRVMEALDVGTSDYPSLDETPRAKTLGEIMAGKDEDLTIRRTNPTDLRVAARGYGVEAGT